MPESSQNNRFSSSDSQGETTSWQPPLGLQHPLVIANPLGQSFLSPKFLSPLGAQPLGGGNPLGSSAQGLPDYNLSENFFQDSPSLAESQLSLNPPEAPVTTAATPTVGMDSDGVNIQRYPEETPTANGHENKPIPAEPDSLSEAESRPVGHDAQAITEELPVAAPHEQLGASDTQPFNPTVVQPKFATEPILQRESAIPEVPEAVEPSRESSVSQSESRIQIPEVAEEPSAIANANPSVMRSPDLSNMQSPQPSPVEPLPSLPTAHLSGIEPIVRSEAELLPVHAIEPAQDTQPNTEDVASVPVQRQEDDASPPSLVESLPLASQALPDASPSPQSFVQTQATADSPPPLNPPTAESPPAIAPVLASDKVNVQPFVQPKGDREAVAIAETSDLAPSTEGVSATTGESLQHSGITPSEPTVIQAFSETESSALSQTAAAPLEFLVLTEPQHHQSSIIDEPVADSSTPSAKPELATITPSSSPTLEKPQQRTETPSLDTNAAPSHAEIVQPRLEREPSAQSEAAFTPASDAATQPEPLVSPAPPVTEVLETPVEVTPVAESEPTIAQPFSEPESSELSEEVSSQDNEPSIPSIPTPPTADLSTSVHEPIANALPTSTESGAIQTSLPESVVQSFPEQETINTAQNENEVLETPDSQLISDAAPTTMQAEGATQTNLPEPVVQPLPEPEAINALPNEVLETPDTQLISQTTPTVMKAEEVPQEVQRGAPLVEETGEQVQPEENSAATPLPTSDPASTPSASSTNLLQRSTTADDESSQVAATPESLSAPVESTAQLPQLTTEKTTVSETERTTPVTHSESPLHNQQQPIEVTQPDEMTVAPKLESALTTAESQAVDTNIVSAPPESVSPGIESTEGSLVQPLLETESSAQTQVSEPLPPELSVTAGESELTAIAPSQQEMSTHADSTSSTSLQESFIQTQPLLETEETAPSAIAPSQQEMSTHADSTSPTSLQESFIQTQPLLETEETPLGAIAPSQQEMSTHADITSPTTPEESSIQRQPLLETEETAASAIAPSQQEMSTHPDSISPTTLEESPIQRQPLLETEEMAASAIAPSQQEAGAHADSTSPTTLQESAIQTQPLLETEETAASAIAPSQQEMSTHADSTSPTTLEESAIQTQPLLETEETAASAIAPSQQEMSTHADSTSPATPEESSIQTQLLPETAPVDTVSTPSASETEIPSSISQAITTDSTLVMPKALPDEATPVPYPTQPESLQPTEISQPDANTSLTEPIIAQPLLESDTNLQSQSLPTVDNFEQVQENSPQVSPVSLNSSALPAHLLQTQTNLTEDDSFNQNQDVPQLPTVLENLVGTRHTLPLIQPLNQQSSLLSTTSTPEFSREQSTIVQSMPETLNRLVVPSTAPSALPENGFSQGLQSTVKVPPVSLDTEPLTLQRSTDVIPQTTLKSNQEPQRVGYSTYTSEVPDSWSNIADLLENTTTHSSSVFGGEAPIRMAFNDSIHQEPFDWQESNNWENLIPESSRSSDTSSTISQETPIQRFTTEEASVQDDTSATENPAQDKDAQDEDKQNLEILAREIYSLVQQRLAIERERYGHYH